jgi:hypothetical protein
MSERGWQEQILDRVPSGIDGSQIDDWLRLTPTERLERMRNWLESIERAGLSDGHGLPKAPRDTDRP